MGVKWLFSNYLILLGCKNKCQKDKCLKEIGLHAKHMLTILSLVVTMDVGSHMTT